MLKSMRKNLKSLSIFLWIVIFSFVFFIFVDWGAGRLGPNVNMDTIAWVKKHRILTADFKRTLLEREDYIKREQGEKARAYLNSPQFPQMVLQQMIQETVLIMKAEELGIRATDEEVREKILSYPVFKNKDGSFVGYERYKQTLAYFHMTIPQFENSLRKGIIIEKLKQYLTAGITATPEEAFQEYKNDKESAKISYYLIKFNEVPIKTDINENELKKYFNEHKSDFKIPEKRTFKYVLFSTDEYKKKVNLSESDLRKYYDENIDRFKIPEKRFIKRIFVKKSDTAKDKIDEALKELKAGKDFSEVAKKYSEDKKAKNGGDWGAFEWRYFVTPEEKSEIEKLSENSVSPVIKSDKGFSIIFLYKLEPAKVSTFDEVKDRIKSYLTYQKTQELVLKDAQDFYKKLGKKDIEKFAKKKGYKVREAKELTNTDSIPNVDPSGAVAKSVFQLKKVGEATEPVFTFKGAVVAQLKKITKERQAKYDEVDDKVKEAYTNFLKRESAKKIAEQILSKIKSGQEIDTTLPYIKYKDSVTIRHNAYVNGVGYLKSVERYVFKAPVNSISSPFYTESGYLIVKVLEKDLKTKADFEKEKEAVMKKLIETKKNSFLLSYLQKLMEEYNVKINNYVLETFTKKGQ